jgi:hypothetical protein
MRQVGAVIIGLEKVSMTLMNKQILPNKNKTPKQHVCMETVTYLKYQMVGGKAHRT